MTKERIEGRVNSSLDIYSHVVPGLQEAAARRFEEGLEGAPIGEQSTKVQ